MDRRLLKLNNVPKASGFLINNMPGDATLRKDGKEAHGTAKITWSPNRGLFVSVAFREKGMSWWKRPGSIEGYLSVSISEGVLQGWQMHLPRPQVAEYECAFFAEASEDVVVFWQGLCEAVFSRPKARDAVSFRYYIPNFQFHGISLIGRYRKRAANNSFSFIIGGDRASFRQVEDYEVTCKRIQHKHVQTAITCVLEVNRTDEIASLNERVCLCMLLIEAFHGAKIRPVAYGGYDADGDLIKLTFKPEITGGPGRRTPELITNVDFPPCVPFPLTWESFFDNMLPEFFRLEETFAFRTVCWQMVEARKVSLPSGMAILIMVLESMSASYLRNSDSNPRLDKMDLAQKLNKCKNELRCFPKRFKEKQDRIRREIRNPLFHQGRTQDPATSKHYDLYRDLFDACAALMAAICGYRGRIGFTCAGGDGMTVDEYVSGKTI